MKTDIFKNRLLALQNNLLSFAYTLTCNRDDAYDLLQDTTIKALDSQDKYVDNTNFKGWVFTIMRNLFINNYRASMRASVVIDRSDDLYTLNLSQESGLETPEGAVTEGEIMNALKSLAPEYREPFSMFLQGYRYAEIARHFGTPLGTIKSRIFVARKRLQGMLADLRYER